MNDWYAWVVEQYADILAEIRPDLLRNELCRLSAVMNSMLEGMAPYFGYRRVRMKSLVELDMEVQKIIKIAMLSYPNSFWSNFENIGQPVKEIRIIIYFQIEREVLIGHIL